MGPKGMAKCCPLEYWRLKGVAGASQALDPLPRTQKSPTDARNKLPHL